MMGSRFIRSHGCPPGRENTADDLASSGISAISSSQRSRASLSLLASESPRANIEFFRDRSEPLPAVARAPGSVEGAFPVGLLAEDRGDGWVRGTIAVWTDRMPPRPARIGARAKSSPSYYVGRQPVSRLNTTPRRVSNTGPRARAHHPRSAPTDVVFYGLVALRRSCLTQGSTAQNEPPAPRLTSIPALNPRAKCPILQMRSAMTVRNRAG